MGKQAAKTVVAIASMPERVHLLEKAVESLRPQVAAVRVYLNGFGQRPPFLDLQEGILSSETAGDLGATGKFFWFYKEKYDYYLTADDDLLYPANYVERMVEEFNLRKKKAIVGVHGFVFSVPIESYTTSRKEKYKCTYALESSKSVHVIGTGTAILHPDTIKLQRNTFALRNTVDLQLAIAAQKQRVPMVVIPRGENWIKELQEDAPNDGYSIWKETKADNGQKKAGIARNSIKKWRLFPDPIK